MPGGSHWHDPHPSCVRLKRAFGLISAGQAFSRAYITPVNAASQTPTQPPLTCTQAPANERQAFGETQDFLNSSRWRMSWALAKNTISSAMLQAWSATRSNDLEINMSSSARVVVAGFSIM